MKRSNALKRTPLKPSTARLRRTTRLRYRSKRREAASGERRAFVRAFLAEHPTCQVCPYLRPTWRASVDVHESLRRSAGGAIVPGPKATEQGQTFWALCRDCHDRLTNPIGRFREYALRMGWIQTKFRRTHDTLV